MGQAVRIRKALNTHQLSLTTYTAAIALFIKGRQILYHSHSFMVVQTDAPYARETEHATPQTLQGRLSKWELTPNMRVGAETEQLLKPYELLQDSNAERLEMKSDSTVVALATPLRCETGPVYLGSDGRFFCGHGSEFVVKALPSARKQACVNPTETPIKKPHRTIRRRFQTKICRCHLVLPNRATFPELPLVTEREGD